MFEMARCIVIDQFMFIFKIMFCKDIHSYVGLFLDIFACEVSVSIFSWFHYALYIYFSIR
jgi:hypothetical protein